MDDFSAEMCTVGSGAAPASDPARFVLSHHRSGAAEIRVGTLSGGHLLHLAVAGCVYNTVFAIAAERNVGLRTCRVRVSGGFEASPPRSTGITYEIELGGDASTEELTAIAHDADSAAPVPNLLREATEVRLDKVLVHHVHVR